MTDFAAQAALLLDLGKLKEAEDAARKAVAADPDAAGPYLTLAQVFCRQRRHAEAEQAAGSGVAKAVGWDHALVVLGWAQAESGKLREAEATLRDALRLNAAGVAAWSVLAFVLRRQGKPQSALRAAREGMRIDPDHLGLWVHHGWAEYELGRFSEAADTAERGLKLHPQAADLHGLLGTALWALGGDARGSLLKPAIIALREAVRLDPTADWARENTRAFVAGYRQPYLLAASIAFILGATVLAVVCPRNGRFAFPFAVIFLVMVLRSGVFVLTAPIGWLGYPTIPLPAGEARLGRWMWRAWAVVFVIGAGRLWASGWR